VLNLALWFSLQTLFTELNEIYFGPLRLLIPNLATLDWVSLIIALAAFIALFRYKVSMIKTLAASATAGFIYFLIFLA